jgi:hypothetical protein
MINQSFEGPQRKLIFREQKMNSFFLLYRYFFLSSQHQPTTTTIKKKTFDNKNKIDNFVMQKMCMFVCNGKNTAEEHLAELMPIFEQLRAQGDLPCTYPLHVSSSCGTAFIRGSRSTPLSPHAPHCHPASHWVSCKLHFYCHPAMDIEWTRDQKVFVYCVF